MIEDEETGEANLLSFEDFARGTDIEKHIYSVVDSFNSLYILTPESLSCYENQLGIALLDYLSDNITDTTFNILDNVFEQIDNDITECEEEDDLTNS